MVINWASAWLLWTGKKICLASILLKWSWRKVLLSFPKHLTLTKSWMIVFLAVYPDSQLIHVMHESHPATRKNKAKRQSMNAISHQEYQLHLKYSTRPILFRAVVIYQTIINTIHSGIFWKNFKVFCNVVKQCLEC